MSLHPSKSSHQGTHFGPKRFGLVALLVASQATLLACSTATTESDGVGGSSSTTSGGAQPTGGTSNQSTGGSPVSSSSGGSSARGGATANSVGGQSSSGGTNTTGGSSDSSRGGTSTSVGGVSSATGGKSGTGGSTQTSSGGTSTSTGGRTSAAGSSSVGGKNAGGTDAIGGSSNRGGAGGVTGIGGNNSGGAGGKSGTGGTVNNTAGSGNSGSGGGSGGFRPCPTNGDACKILPLGDSITYGMQSSDKGGYRSPLFKKVVAANQKVTFTGSQADGPSTVSGVTFPKNHEGHSGWTIDQIAGLVPSPAMNTIPNIVLLMAGTNDVYAASGQSTMQDRLGTLIDKVTSAAPNALLVVATLTPLSNASWQTTLNTYNGKIPAVVQAKVTAGKHVILVDMSKMPTSQLSDGVHPNDAGYAYMADVWYAAIKDVL